MATRKKKKKCNGKRRVQKRVSAALSKWLKKQNPAMKAARSVRVRKCKDGSIKISPVK